MFQRLNVMCPQRDYKCMKTLLKICIFGAAIVIALLAFTDTYHTYMKMFSGNMFSWEHQNDTLVPQNSTSQYNTQLNSTSTDLSTRTTQNPTTQQTQPQISSTTDMTDTTQSINNTTTITVITRTEAPPEKLMTSWTNGRLGNQMGIHAISLGLAQMNGYTPIMQPDMAEWLGEYFDLQTPTMSNETKYNLPWTEKWPTDYMQEEYLHWTESYIQIEYYLNSWTFYHHIKPTIVKEYTFKKVIQDEAQRILHEIRNKIQRNATFVGVHVRRGDYVTQMRVVHQGVIADKHYMDEATDIFRSRYNDAVFVVLSDDKPWCIENINSSLGDVFVVEDSPMSSAGQDMATLVACNHTIMTFGTYGFWAAYLCGGDVVYLANYTLPETKFPNIQKPSAFYRPEWHGIAADLSPLYNITSTTSSSVPTST